MGKKTDDMKDAIKRGQAASGGRRPAKVTPKLPAKLPPWHPAAAATAKKPNPRSAAARDARAKARGRLPEDAYFVAKYRNGVYTGRLVLHTRVLGGSPGSDPLVQVKEFEHQADGLFRFMEELDVLFWNWFASDAEGEIKRLLVFDSVDHKPEPMPKE